METLIFLIFLNKDFSPPSLKECTHILLGPTSHHLDRDISYFAQISCCQVCAWDIYIKYSFVTTRNKTPELCISFTFLSHLLHYSLDFFLLCTSHLYTWVKSDYPFTTLHLLIPLLYIPQISNNTQYLSSLLAYFT